MIRWFRQNGTSRDLVIAPNQEKIAQLRGENQQHAAEVAARDRAEAGAANSEYGPEVVPSGLSRDSKRSWDDFFGDIIVGIEVVAVLIGVILFGMFSDLRGGIIITRHHGHHGGHHGDPGGSDASDN